MIKSDAPDMSLPDAARALGLHPDTLRRLARQGAIEVYAVNPQARSPRYRVTPSALSAFRAGSIRPVPPPPPRPDLTPAQMVAEWEREGVIGAWNNRTDITDNGEFARELRRRSNTRDWSDAGE